MKSVQPLPAIDLKDGKCVRLRQGKAEDVTVYADDPAEMARHWEQQGAAYLHVVDLDGAFEGHPVHTEVIARIVEAVAMPVEVGGGLREDAHIEELLAVGVDRAILGTRAFSQPEALEGLAARFGRHLAVGIDARDGNVQVRGWTHTTDQKAVDLARLAEQAGVQTLIYTDTSRDGMLQGVNAEAMDRLCASVSCQVIASGGVTTADDMTVLRKLGRDNLTGAIVGKALYEKTVSLPDLIAAGTV